MINEFAQRIEAFFSRSAPLRGSQGHVGIALGTVRGPREDNQDRAAAAYVSFPSGEGVLIGLICDGMGGMVHGAAAAECATGAFLSGMIDVSGRSLREALLECVFTANQEVYRRFRGAGGTTLTALAVADSGEAWAAHVGDSRLYEIAYDRVPQLITRDDTIGGQLGSSDSTNDEKLDSRLLQFVGIGTPIEPHVFRVSNGLERSFLLTSDGAHSIGKKALQGVVSSTGNMPDLVRKVLFIADAMGIDDNCSAVAIKRSVFETPKNYTGGIEVTLWSPSEKLEMWLMAPRVEVDQTQNGEFPPLVSTNEKRTLEQKQKKSDRKARQIKKSENSKIISSPEKPQLNIEFGSRTKDIK